MRNRRALCHPRHLELRGGYLRNQEVTLPHYFLFHYLYDCLFTGAPGTPVKSKVSHSAERAPSRKSREAPKPPVVKNEPNRARENSSADIRFVSSRARESSMEDLTQMDGRRRNEVKRSSSNHGTRPSGK